MPPDSDSQVPIFLERLRTLFRSSEDEGGPEADPNRGVALTVCVLLSLVLWLSLTLQEQRMVTVDFPVEIGTLPEGQALVERLPSTVSVKLQGTGLDLLALMVDPPSIPLAAEQSPIDVQETLDLSRRTDARVESVTPQTIPIQLEPRVERRVPVRPRLRLQPAPDYELIGPPRVSPDSITVAGAESIVNAIEAWPTDSLRMDDVRDTVRTDVALSDSLSRLVDRSATAVTVVARAGKFAEETREVNVEVTGIPAGQDLVTLQPSSIRIRYRVLFDQLFESRRSSEFFATVAYDQIRSDTTGYVRPNINVPSELEIRDPEPIPSRLRYYTFLTNE